MANRRTVLPILGEGAITLRDDTELTTYRVAYLHSLGAATRQGERPIHDGGRNDSEKLPAEVFRRDFTVDIVFVIDTTNSMQPWIKGVKSAVAEIGKRIKNHPLLKDHIRLGLVAYRDKMGDSALDEKMEYVTRIYCQLDDGRETDIFLEKVRDVQRADIGSEDFPEDVFAGLKVAIESMSWNPISTKNIVLIGDASAQDAMNTYKNVEKLDLDSVLFMAQQTEDVKKKIVIHALRIDSGGSDANKCDKQYAKLAKGREFAGLYHTYDPQDSSQFIEGLLAVLEAQVKDSLVIRDPETSLNLADLRDLHDSGLLSPVAFTLVRDTVLPAEGEESVPVFSSGWTCERDHDENLQLEPMILVNRGKLMAFHSSMKRIISMLDQASEGGEVDIKRALKTLRVIASCVNLGEPVTEEMPLSKLLNYILGIPIKSDILEMNIHTIKAMTKRDYQAWVNSLRSREQITRITIDNHAIWRSLGSSKLEDDKLAFVKISDMP